MTRRDVLLDAAVLTLLVFAALVSAVSMPGATPGHRWLAGTLLVVQCGLALGRRRAPVAMLWACAGCTVLDLAVASTAPVWTWAVLAFGVALRVPLRRAAVTGVASTLAAFVLGAVAVELVGMPGDRDRGDLADVPGEIAGLAVIVGPVLLVAVGIGVGVRRSRARLAARRAAQESERIAGALVAQRERIAADLSALVVARVQSLLAAVTAAGVHPAPAAHAPGPDVPTPGTPGARAVARVGDEARAALAGMRRALGLLRDPPTDPAAAPGETPDPVSRRRRWAPTGSGLVAAAAVAALTAGSGVAVAVYAPPGPRSALLGLVDIAPDRPWTWIALAVQALALGWWRRAPLAALAAATGGSAVAAITDSTHAVTETSWFLLVDAAGTGAAPLASGIALLACSTVLVTTTVATGALVRFGSPSVLSVVLSYALAAGVWGVAVARRRATLAQERAARDRALDREVRATRAQRLGLARDLHDVLAHELSALVVTTNAAAAGADTAEVAATIRAAGERIRGVLPSLLSAAAAPTGGSLDAADVDALVAPARAAGLPVQVQVRPDPAPDTAEALPTLFARRILTESLTNVLRHAGASPTTLRVEHRPDALVVVVTDRGPPADRAPGPGGGSGLGLVGMRERATLLGGTLEAGPGAAGGWCVRARLPLDGALILEEEPPDAAISPSGRTPPAVRAP